MHEARNYENEAYVDDFEYSDEDIYDVEEIKHLLEDDEISSEEEAFMLGYMGH